MKADYALEQLEASKFRVTVSPATSPLDRLVGLVLPVKGSDDPAGGTFVVSPAGIETGTGTVIAARDIHRIVLRNSAAHVRPVTTKTDPAEVAATDRSISRRARRAWKVWVEAGRRSTTLAAGLDQTTAFAVLTEVSRIMGTPIG